MARDSNQVLVGPGTLYVAAEGTTFPADPSVTPSGSWTDVGYSEDGWSINLIRTTADIEVAETIDPLDVQATKQEAHLVGIMVQGSLENLQTAVGGGTIATAAGPPATKTFTPPASTSLTKYAFLLRTKAPTVSGVAKVRDVQMAHVIPLGAVEMKAQKAPNKTQIALDGRLVIVTPDPLYKIIDLT